MLSYLPFESTTADACGKSWTITGSPTIEKSPAGNNALRNTCKMTASSSIGYNPCTIDFWFYIDLDKFPDNTTKYTLFDTSNVSIGGTLNTLAVTNKILKFDSIDISDISKKRTHIAITRVKTGSGVYKNLLLYIDGKSRGTLKGSGNLSNIYIFSTTTTDYPAYIDHFRIFKGQIVWDGDFTPPVPEDYLK